MCRYTAFSCMMSRVCSTTGTKASSKGPLGSKMAPGPAWSLRTLTWKKDSASLMYLRVCVCDMNVYICKDYYRSSSFIAGVLCLYVSDGVSHPASSSLLPPLSPHHYIIPIFISIFITITITITINPPSQVSPLQIEGTHHHKDHHHHRRAGDSKGEEIVQTAFPGRVIQLCLPSELVEAGDTYMHVRACVCIMFVCMYV